MNLFVKRAVATLVLAAQSVGMGAAAQAAGVHADAAAQAAPAGAVVQAAGTLHDSEPPVKPTPPTKPTAPEPGLVIFEDPIVVYVLPLSREEFGEYHLCAIWDTNDPSLSEEERARLERENEAIIAAHEAMVDREYQEYLAQHEAEYQQAKEQARAEAAKAAWEAAQARYQKELAQYNADYAQYQKDLAQWEIAYTQWEKEQDEAQRKPDPALAPTPGTEVTAPTPGGEVTAPSDGNKTDEKAEEKAEEKPGENGLTEEQQRFYEALLRQNSSRPKSPGQPKTPGQRDQQQQTVENYLPEEQLKYKNYATEDEIAHVAEYLAKYPDGTPWDNDTHWDLHPGYGGCAAYAFQAQYLASGKDNPVSSKNPSDIRKYSVVKISSNIAVHHFIFVLSVDRVAVDSRGNIEYVEVTAAEGNYNSQVKINRTVRILCNSPAGPNLFFEVYNPA